MKKEKTNCANVSYRCSDNEVLKIALIVSVIPSYREGFYDRLFSRKDLFVKVYCQDRIRGMNLKTIHNKYPHNVHLVNFIGAKRDELSWQFIPWREVLTNYDVVFVEGNPRNLSHALLATYLRLCRKKIVLWTMAHSFRANTLTENVRLLWSRIFDFLFVYTDAEVDYLRRKGFRENYIVGMNNGLDQKNIDANISMWSEMRLREWKITNNLMDHKLLLSCARLEPKNKFKQFIQALPAIVDNVPNLLWCVIGNGSEEAELKSMINTAGLVKNVRFVGEIYQETELAPWFLSSEIFVHPAAIGLGLMHAFGYGLPVVTHGNAELHGPEYAAFKQGQTGCNFCEDDIQDLSETVLQLLNNNEVRIGMKKYVQKVAREKYNVDIMVERFVQIAQRASCA